MVTLPKDFVAIRYPGYFWNLGEQRLYSMKISGILRPLAGPFMPNQFNHLDAPAYRISVNGSRRSVYVDYLKKLKAANSTIPMEKA